MTLLNKLTSIQSKLKVPKNRHNNFGNYDYRNAEDILDAVKPLVKKEGLTMKISDHIEAVGMNSAYLVSTVTITDGDQTYSATGCAKDEAGKGMSASQGTGSASSYAKKYALCNLFLIDDGVDDDQVNKHESHDIQREPVRSKRYARV